MSTAMHSGTEQFIISDCYTAVNLSTAERGEKGKGIRKHPLVTSTRFKIKA